MLEGRLTAGHYYAITLTKDKGKKVRIMRCIDPEPYGGGAMAYSAKERPKWWQVWNTSTWAFAFPYEVLREATEDEIKKGTDKLLKALSETSNDETSVRRRKREPIDALTFSLEPPSKPENQCLRKALTQIQSMAYTENTDIWQIAEDALKGPKHV